MPLMPEGSAIDDDARLTVPDHVLTRRAGAETVLLNLENDEYFGLEGVGSDLWRLLEGGTTVGAAMAVLLEEYDVAPNELRADLMGVLEDLSNCGLVLIG